MIGFLWEVTRGYRLRPWQSPYLLWRIETYWGTPADSIGFKDFWCFVWRHRAELVRFVAWADRMRERYGTR
jgi:hypothetical protein